MGNFLRTGFRRHAAALLSATALMGTAQAETTLLADAADTIPYPVLKHKIDAGGGKSSLTVDASSMMDNKLAILFDNVTKAAILMPGTDNKRACPYVDLKQYPHTVTQAVAGKLHFDFEAQIPPAEVQKVLTAQCLIVDIPARKTVIWKDDPST